MIDRWPALFSEQELTRGSLRYSRGVHGKVHRAASDYRWIAATDDMRPAGAQILRTIAFGAEDHPGKVLAWTPFENGYLAVHGYPSRARDAAGRPGGIEKQIMRWTPVDFYVPPALAAFFLLELADRLDDSIWWDSWELPEWRQRDFMLRLREEACEPVPWDVERLQKLAGSGIAALKAAVREESLARFYQAVLDQQRPAVLQIVSGALPSQALTALLLPLPRETAAGISLFSSAIPVSGHGALQNWAAVVCPEYSEGREAVPGETARMLARALFASDPDLIRIDRSDDEGMSPSARYLSIFLASANRSLADPPADHEWTPVQPSELAPLIGQIQRLDAETELHDDFSGDSERQNARHRHLLLKGDLARAWLYACAPSANLLQQLPPRPESVAPALWFAPLVPAASRFWERYPNDDFFRLIEHSLKAGRRCDRVVNWLQNLKEWPFEERIRELL